MKKTAFFSLLILAVSCKTNRFPEEVPADFKIEYHQDGGMVNKYRTITIQVGECKDEGREDNEKDYLYTWKVNSKSDLQELYTSLKKLNTFSIPYRSMGEVMDRGGEKLGFTLDGKEYIVDNSQSNTISKKDAPAFDQSVNLITAFADKNHGTDLKGTDGSIDISTIYDTAKVINADTTLRFPLEMPADFKVKYNMGAGFTGWYKVITIEPGRYTEEGKDGQNGRYNRTWEITKSDLRDLYTSLNTKNAFTIRYQKKGMVYDRGGVELTFTINSKEYVVSNKDNMFVVEKDQERFNSVVQLIEHFADKYNKK